MTVSPTEAPRVSERSLPRTTGGSAAVGEPTVDSAGARSAADPEVIMPRRSETRRSSAGMMALRRAKPARGPLETMTCSYMPGAAAVT